MAKTIWKFPFETADVVKIEMPLHSEVLAVQVQDGRPCIWAIVDPAEMMRPVSFRIYGTGHPISTYGAMQHVSGKYVGTYQEHEGQLVWHMFKMGGPV